MRHKNSTYINEPTPENLTGTIDDKFFIGKGINIQGNDQSHAVVSAFKKGFLSDLFPMS
jgi:hypothetical protein